MHPLLTIAFQGARKAGKLIVQNLDRLDSLTVYEKSTNDFVSDIDKKAEQIIIDTLRQTYPSHGILAEEHGQVSHSDEYTWIIDPLDATQNYLRGFPHFAISIAVQHKGRLEHGLVYDPLRDELFSATRGSGARLNERRLRVATTANLEKAILGTGFPFKRKELMPLYLQTFTHLLPQVCDIRRAGCAALDLVYVAAGRLDGFWEFALAPWDIAAGALIVLEAGGFVSDLNGHDDYLTSGNILAANPKLFHSLQEQLLAFKIT